jgi:hypothetical protein
MGFVPVFQNYLTYYHSIHCTGRNFAQFPQPGLGLMPGANVLGQSRPLPVTTGTDLGKLQNRKVYIQDSVTAPDRVI